MEDNNFDLKKFLIENRLTQATRLQNPTVKEDRHDDLVYYKRDDDNNLTIKGPGGPGGPGDGDDGGGDDDWWDDGGDWEQGERSFDGGVIVTFDDTGAVEGVVPQDEGISEIDVGEEYVRLYVGEGRYARRIYYAYHDSMQLAKNYGKLEVQDVYKEVDMFLEYQFGMSLYEFFIDVLRVPQSIVDQIIGSLTPYRN